MKEEVWQKEEAKRSGYLQASLPGLAFIAMGLFLLIANLAGIHLLDLFWPAFVVFPGALMLWPAYRSTAEHRSPLSFLAVPGTMFVVIGLLLFVMNLTDHYEAWAYSWTLVVAAGGLGLMYARRFEPDHPVHDRGRRFLRVMGTLFLVMMVFFEVVVFETLQPWISLGLIATGLYLLVRDLRQR